MVRTKQRALVTKTISPVSALVYGTILGLIGFAVLAAYTNTLTVAVGIIGFLDYVVLYTYSKRKTIHGTLVGSICGATPILAGYVAVSNKLDGAAWLLFLAMVFWQMPHFYAIAIRRLKEYKAAGIPVLPIKKGIFTTKVNILIYTIAFVVASVSLTLFGYTSWLYFAVMLAVGINWLRLGFLGINAKNNEEWAKRMFLFSLVVLLAFSFSLILDSLIFGKIV